MHIFIVQTVGGFTATGDTGGGVLELIGLAEEWVAAGHEVHFITNDSDRGEAQYRGGFHIHRIPSLGLHRDPSAFSFMVETIFNPLLQWPALVGLVAKHLRWPAVVLTPSPYPSDVLAAFRLRRVLRIPAAVYFHHLSPPPWWHPRRRGNPTRLTINWALWLFALAMAKVGSLLPVVDQPREVSEAGWQFPEIMPNPCFLAPETHPVERMPLPNSACFIGRIAPGKGILDLLDVWARVVAGLGEARLVIAGGTFNRRFEERVRQGIRQRGLEGSVQLRPYASAVEKRKILAQSSLFVFPSYEEGWSISVMEAAHHGVVPVVFDLPAYDYLGSDAIKVPVGDVAAMAERVIQLLREPDRVVALSRAMRAVVDRYGRRATALEQAGRLEAYAASRAPPWAAGHEAQGAAIWRGKI